MSSPRRPLPPLTTREVAACMCVHGAVCSSFSPGHALHLIQARLASATPSDWVDAIVESTDVEPGAITLRSISDGLVLRAWNGAGASRAVESGTPVALHSRYHVLAVGGRRFNVLVD